MAIEKLSVVLELVSGKYKQEAKEAATATGRIGDAAKTTTGRLSSMVGPVAIGGAIVALGRLGLSAIDSASKLEQSFGGVEAVFGEVSDKINEFGESSAESVGLATSSFNNLALLTGALLKNMGLDLDESADKTLVLTERAADLAATFGGPVSSAVEAINSALKGEANPIEAYGIKLNAAAVEARVLADNHGLLKSEITDAHKAQAIYNIILDQSADAAGQFASEADTAAGQQERLNAEMENAKAEIGRGLLPLWVKLIETGRDLVPVVSDIAMGIVEIVEELDPLLEGLGWLVRTYTDVKDKGSELAESDNILVAGWGRMIGEIGILDVLTGNYAGAVEAAITPTYEAAEAAIYMADASKDDLIPAVTTAEAVVSELGTAMSNAATAADSQRTAMINLANAQISLLNPVSNVLRLQQDLASAQEELATAQADGTTPADELALAQLAVAEAMLNVQSAGLALEPDQIQAFAQLLITQFGYSEQAALDTLEALNLLDGWSGTATFTLEMDKVVSGSGATGNFNTDLVGFAGGGTVPGWPGQPQLVLAHGGEIITPPGQTMNSNSRVQNNYFAAPVKSVDLQWLSLMSNLETLVS